MMLESESKLILQHIQIEDYVKAHELEVKVRVVK